MPAGWPVSWVREPDSPVLCILPPTLLSDNQTGGSDSERKVYSSKSLGRTVENEAGVGFLSSGIVTYLWRAATPQLSGRDIIRLR
jgi:hypothetical protein